MSLILPANFNKDIRSRQTNLFPIICIGDYPWNSGIPDFALSTNVVTGDLAQYNFLPLLLNVPSIRESIDIQKRKYKIPNVTIEISNTPYQGIRLSEKLSDAITNRECRIFWVSPSSTHLALADIDPSSVQDDSVFQVFMGYIREYNHDDEKIKLVLEDQSSTKFQKKVPVNSLPATPEILDKYKNKPIPMVYGDVDRSPCVMGPVQTAGEQLVSSKIALFPDIRMDVTDNTGSGVDDDPLWIYKESFIMMQRVNSLVLDYQQSVQYTWGEGHPVFLTAVYEEGTGSPAEGGGDLAVPSNTIAHNEIIGFELLNPISFIPRGHEAEFRVEAGSSHDNHYAAADLIVETGGTFGKGFYGLVLNEYDANDWDGSHPMPELLDVINWERYSNSHEWYEHTYAGADIRFAPVSSDHYKLGVGHLNANVYVDFNNNNDAMQYSHFWGSDNDVHLNIHLAGNHVGQRMIGFGSPNDGIYQDAPFSKMGNDAISLYGDEMAHVEYSIAIYHDAGMVMARSDFYDLFIKHFMLFENILNLNYFVNASGRKEPDDDKLNQVPRIIKDLIETELAYGENFLNFFEHSRPMHDAYISTDGEYANWYHDFCQNKFIDSKKLITQLASASPIIPRFDSMGNFILDVIREQYSDDDLKDNNGVPIPNSTIMDADIIDFSFSKTPIDQIYTKIKLLYNYNYGRGDFDDSIEMDVDSVIPGQNYKFEYYGIDDDHSESTLVIDDDRGKYIRKNDPNATDVGATALAYTQWMLLQHCNQHLKMKVKLSLKYLNLEVGQIVKFDKLLNGVKPYNIDYTKSESHNGQTFFKYFKIISTSKSLTDVTIEAMQMHSLVANSGCMVEHACNYDPLATTNDGSCWYSEPCWDGSYECDTADCPPTPEGSEDCAGVLGGPSLYDCFGNCYNPDSENPPYSEDNYCNECAPWGEGNIPDGECDCSGAQGGTPHYLDECGVCNGDNTTCSDECGVPMGDGSSCAEDEEAPVVGECTIPIWKEWNWISYNVLPHRRAAEGTDGWWIMCMENFKPTHYNMNILSLGESLEIPTSVVAFSFLDEDGNHNWGQSSDPNSDYEGDNFWGSESMAWVFDQYVAYGCSGPGDPLYCEGGVECAWGCFYALYNQQTTSCARKINHLINKYTIYEHRDEAIPTEYSNLVGQGASGPIGDRIKEDEKSAQFYGEAAMIDNYPPDFDGVWLGSLLSLEPGAGYQFKYAYDTDSFVPGQIDYLRIKGTPLVPWLWTVTLFSSGDYQKIWIGVTTQFPVDTNCALASKTWHMFDHIKGPHSSAEYILGIGWVGGLQRLNPGTAYLLTMVPTSPSGILHMGSDPDCIDGEPNIGLNCNGEVLWIEEDCVEITEIIPQYDENNNQILDEEFHPVFLEVGTGEWEP